MAALLQAQSILVLEVQLKALEVWPIQPSWWSWKLRGHDQSTRTLKHAQQTVDAQVEVVAVFESRRIGGGGVE